ncbi:tRNA (adenosine(37)-N6)-threonylcarbamoyltransferase complex dimerization subunit type 1 TsaB [Ciceribacter ferrooxidans]|uniref:tRNA (Adenosine(37)-N6)-threonylcarbamoyltransferase complex dimerization subunit type 1 TsaB n=1 Tax=Ciceribacter ferrooxidans TaxID=2509717 RepID=A0A4Q2SVT0_9HYPH|nr:tRNA (adenosine(37)-N6)-threonylcarbamoyltransferase complex dimerization subunit type 1 TsaB [Ciceribacter ferrooxidans]RYC09942.1 tRNA (adenosine(37)-N6)-threonylcarbamoyltransferase complex dimerization subunit type 1 TsaB [Ciceribacter ferrooxidans]
MIVLAIDTAGVDCSAAVYDSDRGAVLGQATETIGRGHAEKLMEKIDAALAEAGLSLEAVERIAVTVGPGSFTGIRVGVAAARGLALALGIPAVGVSTLAVLASAEAGNAPVVAAIDAKRDEIYIQAFDQARAISQAIVGSVEDARDLAESLGAHVTGSAAPLLAGDDAETLPDHFPIAIVAKLGAVGDPAGKPKPLYLRGPDAKPQAGFAIARV